LTPSEGFARFAGTKRPMAAKLLKKAEISFIRNKKGENLPGL
jgi:hypothetical protein